MQPQQKVRMINNIDHRVQNSIYCSGLLRSLTSINQSSLAPYINRRTSNGNEKQGGQGEPTVV
jgi:hypothetical protein